jgi:hypothetical protein
VQIKEIQVRLTELLKMEAHILFVVVGPQNKNHGWAHKRPLLIEPGAAELGGLIVDNAWRRAGMGKALLG